MSYYDDDRRRYRPAPSRRRDSYDDDTVYTSRDTARSNALVRRRDSYDSVEEISRDFSPPRGVYSRETTIRKSGTRPARTRSFEDDRYDDDDRSYYDDRSYASTRRDSRYYDDRRVAPRSRRYSSDYSSRSRTPPRKEKDRRKSKTDDALEALGLSGLVATLTGKKDSSRERDRDRDRYRRSHSEDRHSSSRRDKGRGPSKEQVTQALKAAILAGAGEAVRARKEPGGWTGDKGKRVLTAMVSAGGVDGLISHSRREDDHSTRNAIGSAIAGIATSRIVNGPRSKSRGGDGSGSPDGRVARRRSQSRSGAGDLAAGGILAATAKKIYDTVNGGRSESRGRQRSRSRDDYDSRSPSRNKSRRRSLSRGLARSLSAVGLNKAADRVDPDRRKQPPSKRYDDYDSRSGYYEGDDGYGDDVGQPRSGPPNQESRARSLSRSRSDWQVGPPRRSDTGDSAYTLDFGPRHTGDPDTDSDSDLGSSSGEEKDHKRSKRKLLLTSGLATIATIHAGHSVYQSYEKRHARHKAVKEGKISAEQAKSNRNRDRLQDAASLGLAALGVKGAYSEWKELHEHRTEMAEELEKAKRHHDKRVARREKYEVLASGAYPAYHESSSMPDLHAPRPTSGHGPPYGHPHDVPWTDSPEPYNGNYGGYQNGNSQYNGTPNFPQNGPHYYDGNPYGAMGQAPSQMPGPPMPPPGPLGAGFMSPPPNGNVGHTGQRGLSPQPDRTPRPRSLSPSPSPLSKPTTNHPGAAPQ